MVGLEEEEEEEAEAEAEAVAGVDQSPDQLPPLPTNDMPPDGSFPQGSPKSFPGGVPSPSPSPHPQSTLTLTAG